jgi:hypothetical protein
MRNRIIALVLFGIRRFRTANQDRCREESQARSQEGDFNANDRGDSCGSRGEEALAPLECG